MKKSTLILATLAAIALPAAAQQSPWHVSVQAGQSKFDISGLSGDNKDKSFLLGLGYALSPNLAIEGGYADFGKVSILGVSGEAKSTYVGALLSAPLSDSFSVYGRLAAASTDRKVSGFGLSEKDRKTEALYGAGMAWNFNKNIAATLEYMKLGDSDVDAINLGLKFNF